jgi:hypothetical protein
MAEFVSKYDVDQLVFQKFTNPKIFNLSRELEAEVPKGNIRSEQKWFRNLYEYFWKLIENNRQNCLVCQKDKEHQSCYNRYFLNEIKNSEMNENDLYALAYIATYILDLLVHRGLRLSEAYYVLSFGHDSVLAYIEGRRLYLHKSSDIVDEYQGYFLSVIYYLLPNFKYMIETRSR